MFRHGYRADYPQQPAVTENQVQESINGDIQRRRERSEQMNQSKYRTSKQLQPGDVVITRNKKRTSKYQPMFDPTPRIVESAEPGGAICISPDGSAQRRHIDDIKPITLIDPQENHVYQENSQERPTREVPITMLEQDSAILAQIPSPPPQAPRRSQRNTQPIERYESASW